MATVPSAPGETSPLTTVSWRLSLSASPRRLGESERSCRYRIQEIAEKPVGYCSPPSPRSTCGTALAIAAHHRRHRRARLCRYGSSWGYHSEVNRAIVGNPEARVLVSASIGELNLRFVENDCLHESSKRLGVILGSFGGTLSDCFQAWSSIPRSTIDRLNVAGRSDWRVVTIREEAVSAD